MANIAIWACRMKGDVRPGCCEIDWREAANFKPDVLTASTMRRAQETAAILAPALGQSVILDPDFEEWRGDDGSVSPEEFMIRWQQVPKEQKAYFRWQDGYENRLEFSLRVYLTLNRVLQEHTEKTIGVVTHGAFIQLSFAFFFGYGEAVLDRTMPEIRRTSITHWMKPEDDSRWVLERSNDCHHLV